jgi:hypothetical protein
LTVTVLEFTPSLARYGSYKKRPGSCRFQPLNCLDWFTLWGGLMRVPSRLPSTFFVCWLQAAKCKAVTSLCPPHKTTLFLSRLPRPLLPAPFSSHFSTHGPLLLRVFAALPACRTAHQPFRTASPRSIQWCVVLARCIAALRIHGPPRLAFSFGV